MEGWEARGGKVGEDERFVDSLFGSLGFLVLIVDRSTNWTVV